ncbi:signaling lymphocytic activation molecule-like [Melopsittacus undulatus]|uniref:signaling lymphocytic activation molecule-like n=1 Tax=Melopsittacus undulatus TaxID=13146 RepID=UPI00146E58F8|nr:signaling lymphocytic activation molecule-like [Melopsittacus undulatus]
MGWAVQLCLLVTLGCPWGRVHGVRETVLGTLGKPTMLRIPPALRELTLRFGAAVWKRDTEDPQRKLILLKYTGGNYTNYVQDRTRFHELDFSLEILNTSRQDQQLYEYTVSEGPEEKVWRLRLQVYEPVSDPSIQILSWVLANGTCSITLNCTAERGDSISYSWGTSGPCSHNSSLLHLTFPLHNSSISCSCTTSNPVSSRSIAFNSSQCSHKQAGSASLGPQGLLLMVLVPIAAGMLMGVLMALRVAKPRGGQQAPAPAPAEDSTVHTIYSQVQRRQKQKGASITKHPSCITIYTTATSQPLDTALAPSAAPCASRDPPAQPHTSQGHRIESPSKEPTTVYARVMMPTA